jgi:hypothetical protein
MKSDLQITSVPGEEKKRAVLSSGEAAAQHRTKSSPSRRRMHWDSSRKQRGGEFEGWGE